MLDLFTIFSKGGIVLWCFQGTTELFTSPVNALIKNVILQERSGSNSYQHGALMLKYRLDNEFELVFVVAYQRILELSYVDKFLSDIQLAFRDKYKDDLQQGRYFQAFQFNSTFRAVLDEAESFGKIQQQSVPRMRTFDESQKSKKTVASMIERKGENKENKKPGKGRQKGGGGGEINTDIKNNYKPIEPKLSPKPVKAAALDEETLQANRQMMAEKLSKGKKKDKTKSPQATKGKKTKQNRIWENAGTSREMVNLDFSSEVNGNQSLEDAVYEKSNKFIADPSMVGHGRTLRGIDVEMENASSSDDDDDDDAGQNQTKPASSGRSVFSMFKSLVGNKTVTREDVEPILNKLREHLIGKNVAADIASKLCDSVAAKLEGKVLGTFTGVSSTVKTTLTESLVQILSPKRRIDILRDIMEAQKNKRPYTVAFCGVNGVGKSTNLAKICFWLTENNFRVLIAACDTFRAGAVEQLRTHTRHLNALHPPDNHGGAQMVQLYEKGYGKDAAGIAMEAINYARDTRIDVVLIDTAGRMQDNEPLMRALAKLIKVNEPDLVLFVGEALVGNEAVDQLVKFNQALADHSSIDNPHLIDGIVLTKFDTIDDKVGAAISMTYITGQPIVFVGTGQTYTDLRALNGQAVVRALMK